MKRFLLLFAALIICLTGCSSPSAGSSDPAGSASELSSDAAPKILVAYFSRTGNTGELAKTIQSEVGGDLFEIKTVKSYPEEYDAALAEATAEKNDHARPELAVSVEGMESYDILFVGYPIWWGDTPMAVLSFLEGYDLTGKTVVPFCTYGSSGVGNSVNSIRASASGATVLDGFGIAGSEAGAAGEAVRKWLETLALTGR